MTKLSVSKIADAIFYFCAGAAFLWVVTQPGSKAEISFAPEVTKPVFQALKNPQPIPLPFTPMESEHFNLNGNPSIDITKPENKKYYSRFGKITNEQIEIERKIMANPINLPDCSSPTRSRLWSVYFQPINRDYGSFDWIVCQKTSANGNLTYMISKTPLWDMDMVQAKPVSLQAQSQLIKSYLKAKN